MTVRGAGKVLVADDEPAIAEVIVKMLSREGYDVECVADGQAALEAARRSAPDIVLLDVVMPRLTGFDVCRQLKRDPATRLIPVVLVTSLQGREDRLQGIDAGADDFLAKPFDPAELLARVKSLVRLKRHTDELDSAESVILSLALTIEARDTYTEGHCHRLAHYAATLGAELGLGAEDLASLRRGGFLHDVGKIAVPDSILLKAGRLTPGEFEIIKRHTVVGASLCGTLNALRAVRPIVRHHHERLDGSGYPDGLGGDAIPLLAQIMGAVDVYDALTTDRPYRSAMRPEVACEYLLDEVRRGWRRRELVDRLIRLHEQGRLQLPEPAVPGTTEPSAEGR